MASLTVEVDAPAVACLYLMKRGYFVRLRPVGEDGHRCELLLVDNNPQMIHFVCTGRTRLDAIRGAVRAAGIQPEPAILDAS